MVNGTLREKLDNFTNELHGMRFNLKKGLASQKRLSVSAVDFPRDEQMALLLNVVPMAPESFGNACMTIIQVADLPFVSISRTNTCTLNFWPELRVPGICCIAAIEE